MPKPDWGNAVQGGVQGGISGASTGNPYIAGASAVTGFVGGLFGGKKKKKKLSTMDKRQQALNEQQYQGIAGEGPLADLYNYDPEMANDVFQKNIADPAYRNFNELTAPSVMGQFRSNNLGQSSYAGDAVAKIARDVQESLNAQRSQYLYGEQKEAQNAKRTAVENLQNRQTFAYDKEAQTGVFDINKILDSLDKEDLQNVYNLFSKKKQQGVA